MEIRLLQEEDYLIYKEIRLELLDQHPTNFGSSKEDESQFEDDFWKTRLRKPTVDTYGLFDGNHLIGLSVVVYSPRTKMKHSATLNSVYIKPEYRKQGLASMLLDRIIKDVTDKGLHRLRLSVVTTNKDAITLYESRGFESSGIELEGIFYDGQYYNQLLMSLRLKNR
jgi:ribosomal protein S18 acetylase RimI-like enzyme